MSKTRRTGVYAVTKKGRRYWEFKAKDPYTNRWFTQSVSKKMLKTLELTPSGRNGTITEKDAQTARTLFEQGLKELPAVQPRLKKEATPVSAIFERYLDSRCIRNTDLVIERKKAVFAEFIDQHGDLPAHELTDQHASSFLHRLLNEGTSKGGKALSPATARDYFGYIKAAFHLACHLNILQSNPAAYVALPEQQEPGTKIWTPKELGTHLTHDFSDPRWDYFHWIVVGAFSMGLSPLEWQKADWKNYDPERRSILIEVVKKKSSSIRRTEVPIPEVLSLAFKQRQKASGPIWPTANGTFFTKITADSMRGRLRRKWKGFNFLSLRKSYSVYLQDQGLYDMELARLLRHQDGVEGGYRVAKNHYSRRRDFEAVRKLTDRAFEGLLELAALVTSDDLPGPQLRLSRPA